MLDAFEAVSNISSNIEFELLDEMLDWFALAFTSNRMVWSAINNLITSNKEQLKNLTESEGRG